MLTVDLNCDMGEGMATDQHIMPFISSANIACGGHAGDDDSMRRTIELCLKDNVAIGAHPSYPDKKNFGRVDVLGKSVELKDIISLVGEQTDRLIQICKQSGAELSHIKPHGALYNRAAKDAELSAAICEVLLQINPDLLLFGLSGSMTAIVASQYRVRFINEVFADRSYQSDGSLTPRNLPNALIEDENKSLNQVLQILKIKTVTALSGDKIEISADSVCIHGDGAQAVKFAQTISERLQKEGIRVQPPGLK